MSYIDWFCPFLETISPGAQVLCLGFIKEVVVGSDITTLASQATKNHDHVSSAGTRLNGAKRYIEFH